MKVLIFWASIGTKPISGYHSWRNTDVQGSFHSDL